VSTNSAVRKNWFGADPADFCKIWENSVKFIKNQPKSSFHVQCPNKPKFGRYAEMAAETGAGTDGGEGSAGCHGHGEKDSEGTAEYLTIESVGA
jgi:hypothetical protein